MHACTHTLTDACTHTHTRTHTHTQQRLRGGDSFGGAAGMRDLTIIVDADTTLLRVRFWDVAAAAAMSVHGMRSFVNAHDSLRRIILTPDHVSLVSCALVCFQVVFMYVCMHTNMYMCT